MQKQQVKKYHIGQNVDVKDKVNKWVNGEVLGLQNQKIYIHYTGWHPKFDEFIDIDSPYILKQWVKASPILLNNRIDVYHPIGGWLPARVIELGEENQNVQISRVKVHFFDYHPKYDMYVDLSDKNQVAIIGEKSKGYGSGKRKRSNQNNQKVLSQVARQLLKRKMLTMIKQLNQNNFIMKQTGTDGNCLFRAISDQLYGQETYFNQIRHICMKYILQQKAFFQNFIVQNVQDYVQRKSKDGVWGDDIEIQALSEIYSRPIEIFISGIQPIRTFHQDNQQNIQPLRLAYIGSCHYNSIKRIDNQNKGILDSQFGEYQNKFIETYLQSKAGEIYWKNRNRDSFSHHNPLEQTIQQRIQAQTAQGDINYQYQKDLMQQALQISQNQQISKQIQAAQLKQIQKRSQIQAIQKQLKRLEQKQLEQAKKLSRVNQQSLQQFQGVHFQAKSQFSGNSQFQGNSSFQANSQFLQRPYWFGDLLMMGFTEEQVWFGIQMKGYDPQTVQNFLLDNM